MSPEAPRKLFVTGSPGTGKSTLVREVVSRAVGRGVRALGFYTPDVRGEEGRRVGFDFEVIGYGRVPLARKGEPWGVRFGSYTVNPAARRVYELVLVELAKTGGGPTLLVLDEIGPMELLLEGARDFFLRVLSLDLPTVGVFHRRLAQLDPELHRLVVGGLTFDLDRVPRERVLREALRWVEKVFPGA